MYLKFEKNTTGLKSYQMIFLYEIGKQSLAKAIEMWITTITKPLIYINYRSGMHELAQNDDIQPDITSNISLRLTSIH